jgi:hypothetical protein
MVFIEGTAIAIMGKCSMQLLVNFVFGVICLIRVTYSQADYLAYNFKFGESFILIIQSLNVLY